MPDLLRVPSTEQASALSAHVLNQKPAHQNWAEYFISLGKFVEAEGATTDGSKASRWLGLRAADLRDEGRVSEQELHVRRRGRGYQNIEHNVQLISSSSGLTGTMCSIAARNGRVVRVVVTTSGAGFEQTLPAYVHENRPQTYRLLGAGNNESAEVIIGPVTHPYSSCVDDSPPGQYSFELDASPSSPLPAPAPSSPFSPSGGWEWHHLGHHRRRRDRSAASAHPRPRPGRRSRPSARRPRG